MPPGVYDKESPDYLRDREDLENPDNQDNQPAGDPTDPREVGEREQRVGRGYVEEGNASLKGSGLSRRKKWLLAGIGGSSVALIIAFMFGFLGIFKLEHLMSNIDAKVYARMQGVEDRRSRRWMQAYLEMRLADIGDNPDLDKGTKSDNQFFRSERVNNGNPIRDWYRTMRTSKFEQEVFEKRGFKFVSVAHYDNGQVKIRSGKIIMNGNTLATLDIPQADWDGLEKGDTAAIRNYSSLVDLEKYDSDGEARRAIRRMVNDDIPAWRIFLRRHVRKDIQNQIGVRDWRFFEKTRSAIAEKKIEIRNKILNKAIPSSFKSGQILRCLFGVDNCRYSRDAYDPVNQDDGVKSNGSGDQKVKEDFDTDVDDNGRPLLDDEGKPKTEPRKANPTQISEDTAKLAARLGTKIGGSLNAFYAAVNITGTLEMLSQVNQSIPKIAKMAIIAKGAQAMGLFQAFETSRDQTKSGELTATEYNELMRVLNTPTQSEGWHKVVEGNNTNPKNTNVTKEEYCKDIYVPTDKDYHFLCDDKKIGSGGNAKEVQERYDAGPGKFIRPIVAVYDNAKDQPILGSVIKVLNKITSALGELLSKAILGVASVVGLGDDLKSALTWVMGKLAVFLGAGPIIDGAEKAGEFTNWIIQGGAYTAESSARGSGAALTTEASRTAATVSLNEYRSYEEESSTMYSRTLALSNPQSLASKSLFSISNFRLSSIGSLVTAPAKLFSNLGDSFTAKTQAAEKDDGYRAAEFAGLETYDIPPQCYALNPLTAEPLDGTNTLDVFANPKKYGLDKDPVTVSAEDRQLLDSWDAQTDSTKFYALIYKILGNRDDADDIAVTIYNCNLLDNRIRGILGALYGYTADNGLEETGIAPSGSTNSGAGAQTSPSTAQSPGLQQLAQQVLANGNISYPLDAVSPNGSTKGILEAIASGKSAKVTCPAETSRFPDPINLNPKILQAILEYATTNKVGVNALSDKCHGTPGVSQSNHYYGKAVDFECEGMPFDSAKMDNIAAKYGGQRNSETCAADHHWHYDFLVFPTAIQTPSAGGCATDSDYVGEHTGYNNGSAITIRLCAINGLAINDFTSGQEGSESTPGTKYYISGANGRALVEATVSKSVIDMVKAARSDGINLVAFSSFRTNEHQKSLAAGGGAYASAGTSRHQRGQAIDFIDSNRNSTANCRNLPGHTVNGRCVAPGDPIWEWLNKNASRFGYKQLINESWHWSPDGQ